MHRFDNMLKESQNSMQQCRYMNLNSKTTVMRLQTIFKLFDPRLLFSTLTAAQTVQYVRSVYLRSTIKVAFRAINTASTSCQNPR